VDVDGRDADGVLPHRHVGRHQRLAVLDERHVTGGAAHVHREQVLDAGESGHVGRTPDAGGRPRQQRLHRSLAGRRCRQQPAGRAHHARLGADHPVADPVL